MTNFDNRKDGPKAEEQKFSCKDCPCSSWCNGKGFMLPSCIWRSFEEVVNATPKETEE